MDLGIAERTAIVTGGSKGIGRACVEALLAEGVNVCAISRDVAPLKILVDSSKGRLVTAKCDLTTDIGCQRAVQTCIEAYGRIDILINCAGSAGMGNVLDLSSDDIDRALRLKLYGYLRMAQYVAPYMAKRTWGRIVNISGSAGTSPTADNLPTSLANISVHNLTRALSDQLAPSGIQVNLIAPGLTHTTRATELFREAAQQEVRPANELLEEAGSRLPAGRAADPVEVARVACFLSSEACSYVYASTLYMDGGARRATP